MTDPTFQPDPVPTPTPVVDAGKVSGLISALVISVLTMVFLIINHADLNTQLQTLTAVGGAASALITYFTQVSQAKKAASVVTPLAKPRDNLGRRLIPHPEDVRVA
jgi:hypothetical protein